MFRIFFFLTLCIVIAGCQKQPVVKQPVNVSVFQVNPHDLPEIFEFIGVVKSSHQVEIRSRVEGYLMSRNYVEGGLVKKDELLFEIDHRTFEASLEQAKGAQARQEAILWRAKKSLERIEPLYKQNAASLKDYDDAIAQVLAAEASVIEAKANVVQAELNLSWSYISSPVHGWSGRAFYSEGSLINPTTNGLLTYVDIIDPIWVYFSVSDNDLLLGRTENSQATLQLPKEQNYVVTLQLADGSLFPYSGVINFNSPILDPKTATMNVRAQFSNPQGALLPSQFVRAKVEGAYRPLALFVPQEALFQGDKGRSVFVIKENQTVKIQSVQIDGTFKQYTIIKSGLQPGDLVVSSGINKLLDGTKVHITKTTSYIAESIQE